MRGKLLFAAAVAVALAASVVAQQQHQNSTDRRPPSSDRSSRPAAAADGGAPPPGMGPETKLEWYLVRPGKLRVRDSWNVGRLECRPPDARPDSPRTWVRVHALIVRDNDNEADKAAGIEVVLEDEVQDRTFVFDAEQVGEVISALDALDAAGQKLREAPAGATRRAVWSLNGLEIGMNLHRTGGYLAPVVPDEKSVGMSVDDFAQLKRLLQDARDLLGREGK